MEDFKLLWEEKIPDIRTTAVLYKHLPTGADIMLLENDDENKVFAINFVTIPDSPNGVAHILEHSVLNGSHKYPVKEPFAELLRSSLYTYLNALTYQDKTLYPVASTNDQDLYNLASVYWDAVFNPILDKNIFLQEAWRFEPDQKKIQGVVYNEMKGVYANPDSILWDNIMAGLHPDHPYSHDSGGDPKFIATLTHRQLVDFHKKFYIPSNAKIFFYGNSNREKNLEFLKARLDEIKHIKSTPIPAILNVVEWDTPRNQKAYYPAGDTQDTSYVTINWLLNKLTNPIDLLGFEILEYMLVGSDAGILRRALIDSGLGNELIGDFTPGLVKPMFLAGLKGVNRSSVTKVFELIIDTLSIAARDGIRDGLVEGAINQVEFSRREQTSGHSPKGLDLIDNILGNWIYGREPLADVYFEDRLDTIKKYVKSGEKYFEGLIQKYILDNAHRLELELQPDKNKSKEFNEWEDSKIDTLLADKEELENFHNWQASEDLEENIAKLPKLKLSDLPKSISKIPTDITNLNGIDILVHPINTRGIVYMDLGLDFSHLSAEELSWLSLLESALLKFGTHKYSNIELAEKVDLVSGGIYTSIQVSTPQDKEEPECLLFLSSKALSGNVSEVTDLIYEIILNTNLDDKQLLRNLLLEEKSYLENRLTSGAMSLSEMYAAAGLSQANFANEKMKGITYLEFIRTQCVNLESDWEQVRDNLINTYNKVTNPSKWVINITVDKKEGKNILNSLERLALKLPINSEATRQVWHYDYKLSKGFITPATTNSVAAAFSISAYDITKGAWRVIENLVSMDYLWNSVRLAGGAYGAVLDLNSRNKTATFSSLRDPHGVTTIKAYHDVVNYLVNPISSGLLENIKIRTIGDMDEYSTPDVKGRIALNYYLLGITDTLRQQWRDEVFDCKTEDIANFAKHLKDSLENAKYTIIGSEEKVNEALSQRFISSVEKII